MFSTRIFDQNDPPYPEVTTVENIQIQLTSLEVPPVLNSYEYFEVYSTNTPPFFSCSMRIVLPLATLPQKLFQPIVFYFLPLALPLRIVNPFSFHPSVPLFPSFGTPLWVGVPFDEKRGRIRPEANLTFQACSPIVK